MDKTKPMYVDAVTGTYGEQKDLIMVNLNAAELNYFEEDMTGPEIIEYAKALVDVPENRLCSCPEGPKLGKRASWAAPRCGRCHLMVQGYEVKEEEQWLQVLTIYPPNYDEIIEKTKGHPHKEWTREELDRVFRKAARDGRVEYVYLISYKKDEIISMAADLNAVGDIFDGSDRECRCEPTEHDPDCPSWGLTN